MFNDANAINRAREQARRQVLRYKDDVGRRWRIAGWIATFVVGVAAVLAAVADAR